MNAKNGLVSPLHECLPVELILAEPGGSGDVLGPSDQRRLLTQETHLVLPVVHFTPKRH